jgi:hypothetical protein
MGNELTALASRIDATVKDQNARWLGAKHSVVVRGAAQRIAELEAALVALIDAVDAKDARRIEDALFVGKGLTF